MQYDGGNEKSDKLVNGTYFPNDMINLQQKQNRTNVQ